MKVRDLKNLAIEIVCTLQGAGHQAVFAGGCVRDLLMGREPQDYDIATSARPEQVRSLFRHTIPVGERFGVILVIVGGRPFEVASFRGESDYRDGRHPEEVRFADEMGEVGDAMRIDVERRDFTVNGLLYEPLSGEVIDLCGGREDIHRRLIRAIGPPRRRFAEDRLRMLRAVRFACTLDFAIEERTLAAIEDEAAGIELVSAERIRDELLKMLCGPAPRRAMELLENTGLLRVILPEVAEMRGVDQPPEFHPEGDVLTHTLIMLEGMEEPTAELALGVLLHDVGKPPTFHLAERIRFDGHVERGAEMAREICRRLKLPAATTTRVIDLVRQHLRFREVERMRPAKLKRFLRQEDFATHLELHRLDCLASHGELRSHEFCRQRLTEFEAEEREEALRPPPLLGGRDLIELGFTPGPIFGEILTAVEDAQLEGRLHTREAAVAFVLENFGQRRDPVAGEDVEQGKPGARS